MVLDTALTVFFAGLGLWFAKLKRNKLARAIAFAVLLIGVVNFIFKGSTVSLHRLVFPTGSPIFLPDGQDRMAQGAALAFALVGIGLIILTQSSPSIRSLRAVAFGGTIVSSCGLITLIGHATGLRAAPWWGSFFLNLAIPTAISLCFLGPALIAFFWEKAKETPQQLPVTAAVLAILGLLLLFAGVDAGVWASSNSILSARLEIRTTSNEIRTLGDLVEAVRKAETGQRGYLLSGETQYLREFREGRQTFEQTSRTAVFLDRALLQAAAQKFEELQRTISLEANGKHAEALQVVRSSQGIRLMEQIEARAATSESYLRQGLAKKLEKSSQSVFLVRKTVMISYVAALLFVAVALFLVGNEIRRRSHIELMLREKEASLAKANEKLQEQTAKAEEASRAKSSFLASMSHEIRTPMNAILGMADMLWESELSSTQRRYVEVFRRAGGNLLTLINDLLDLSKIEAGNFALEQIDFDLREIVLQATEILAPRAEAKGLSFLAHIEPGAATSVIGDSVRLQQILLNILGNAIKFTEHGEVVLRVRSRCSETHASCQFEVSDSGIGIPKDKLEVIFEPFTQAEWSTTRRFGGTGLGLGISRQLVHLMGGELQVRSEQGKGSTFSFNAILPIGREQKAVGQPSETRSAVNAPQRNHTLGTAARRKILVVEDSEDNRFLLQVYCDGSVYDPAFVGNGEEAVLAYQSGVYDLIAMDIQMPVMDGLTATRRIRVIEQATGRPRIPILALTANALPQNVEEALEAGCDAHLGKPISKQNFLKALTHWLARSEARRAPVLIDIPEGLEGLAPGYVAARQRELIILNAALGISDFEQMRTLAHNMKGTGASYGFPEVTRLGGTMEQAAKDRNLATLAQQLLELSSYIEAASEQMNLIS